MTLPQNKTKHSTLDQKVDIVACADDFGLNTVVDAAIIDLVSQHRLTAVGALVQGPNISDRAAELASLDTDVGLHLNFTESWPNIPPNIGVKPWRDLVLQSYLGRLDTKIISASIEQQLDQFETVFKRAPDFVDGHLHVHQLPGIRQPLLAILKRRYGSQLPWLRDTRPSSGVSSQMPLWQRFKAQVIGFLGAKALMQQASKLGFKANHGFVGAYDFTGAHPPFIDMLALWLPTLQSGGLLMTHPSQASINNDPIGQSRVEEYKVLGSQAWLDLMAQNHCQLVRLSQAYHKT